VQHEAAFAISGDPVASFSSLPEPRGRQAWQCPHSAEGDMRALNEGSGFDPGREPSRFAYLPWSQTAQWKRGIIPRLDE